MRKRVMVLSSSQTDGHLQAAKYETIAKRVVDNAIPIRACFHVAKTLPSLRRLDHCGIRLVQAARLLSRRRCWIAAASGKVRTSGSNFRQCGDDVDDRTCASSISAQLPSWTIENGERNAASNEGKCADDTSHIDRAHGLALVV